MCQHIYLKSQDSRFMGIIFSNVQSHSVMSDSVTPWTVARQAHLSTRILRTRILEWVYMPSPPGDLPNPGIKPRSPTLQVNSLPSESPGKPIYIPYIYIYIYGIYIYIYTHTHIYIFTYMYMLIYL